MRERRAHGGTWDAPLRDNIGGDGDRSQHAEPDGHTSQRDPRRGVAGVARRPSERAQSDRRGARR
jgi:hypothetical protein